MMKRYYHLHDEVSQSQMKRLAKLEDPGAAQRRSVLCCPGPEARNGSGENVSLTVVAANSLEQQ
jgi:hypothetical protein